MPRFMVECSHEPEPALGQGLVMCRRALDAAVEQGSHYITNAWFGCEDGIHKAWVFVDADGREDARGMVPAPARSTAVIVQVRQYTPDEIRKLHTPGTG